MSILFSATIRVAAQCAAPAAVWLVPPQTSTALVVKWSPVSGATQYQLRYWDNTNPSEKTIVESGSAASFILRGLQKNRSYALEIRANCGTSFSPWSSSIIGKTVNSSGTCNANPTGVVVTANGTNIQVNWNTTGSHTIRYRKGEAGDWLIPAGALSNTTPPLLIPGLGHGLYQVEIKRNCSATAGNFQRYTVNLENPCSTPALPAVTPAITSAMVTLPAAPGVSGYQIEYREGVSNNWLDGGHHIPPSIYLLNPPLKHSTLYQVRIQANCAIGTSDFTPPLSFTTAQETGPCLVNKNAGKYLSFAQILQVNQHYNHPSPFTFGAMIGVNDGGLVFRSFANESVNQITELTRQLRNFHTMDEDFNANPENYALNIKPKDTNPEGTPAHTARHKAFYTKYRLSHGFSNITGATEILQYSPQTWKEKIYQESDWSVSGPDGILNAYQNYTKKFIDEFAPANGSNAQMLLANYQVGNELWDYPIKSDYHNLLRGAYHAFLNKYGAKSNGGWKMKLIAGAFQAFRDNNCNSMLRDFSNCNSDLNRFDFIGDYLEVSECDLLRDLDGVDCHPYSFKPGTNTWTYPEDPVSETWQIRNLAAWLYENQKNNTGVLANTHLWSTEYGFDSYGVGEKTQSAYLIRGLLMHSRYHYEKVYFYNAYDVARETDQYYFGLYNSSGFWKLGTHPANQAWASPIKAHGASPKPAWFGMLDFKTRFGSHVFHKALVEDADVFVILIAKPDSTEPYLVFWSPKLTNDDNINSDIPINKSIQWSDAFEKGYTPAQKIAQTFANNNVPGETFEAISEWICGSMTLSAIRRQPAFIPLTSCVACPNISNPGSITQPNPSIGASPFNPGIIVSNVAASGGSGGTVEYQWQQSSDNSNFINILGANAVSYDPPALTQTTYFRRNAKRSVCTEYVHTPAVVIAVGSGNNCPKISTFQQVSHTSAKCNPAGEYYYEIVLDQVAMNEQITLAGLPSNGINIPMCMLNGVSLNIASFQSNLLFVDNNSLKWQVKATNGATQRLLLYYCWAESYPTPVGLTTASVLCSGEKTPCVEGLLRPETEARGVAGSNLSPGAFNFSLSPNPGAGKMILRYEGAPVPNATLRLVSATGQALITQQLSALENQQQLEINTSHLSPGIYFVCLQTETEVKWLVWERI